MTGPTARAFAAAERDVVLALRDWARTGTPDAKARLDTATTRFRDTAQAVTESRQQKAIP